MSLQEYIDQFRRTLEKLQDFGLSEFFDFNQEIRPGKRAVINAKVVLVNETILHIRAFINARYMGSDPIYNPYQNMELTRIRPRLK